MFVEEGRVNGIIAISRAIGDWEYKNQALKPEDNAVSVYPEVIVERISPDIDFLIIACDGIWDCLTNQQAVDFVYQQKSKIAKKGLSGSPDSSAKKKPNASPAGKPSKMGTKAGAGSA